jgi:hypothetical protein
MNKCLMRINKAIPAYSGEDPSGNVICLETKEPYYDKIHYELIRGTIWNNI